MKRKLVLKSVKQQLKEKKERLINELNALLKLKEECESDTLEEINLQINDKITDISVVNQDLEPKGKKSSSVTWLDTDYKPTPRGNGSKDATIVDDDEFTLARERKASFNNGPNPMWLTPGILVTSKDRDVPGIVLEVGPKRANVLFGGLEVSVRKLSLRPAEWD